MILGSLVLTLMFWVFILILTYLLFTPISIRLEIKFGDGVDAIPELRIFPFRYKIRVEQPTKEPVKVEKEKPEKKVRERGRLEFSKLNRGDMTILFRTLVETLKFFGRTIRAPQYFLRAEIAGGASEPDITGELYGAYQALKFALPGAVSVSYRPDFTAEKFSGRVEVGLAFRLARLSKETLVFIFRLPILKLIKLYRKLRTGGKNG